WFAVEIAIDAEDCADEDRAAKPSHKFDPLRIRHGLAPERKSKRDVLIAPTLGKYAGDVYAASGSPAASAMHFSRSPRNMEANPPSIVLSQRALVETRGAPAKRMSALRSSNEETSAASSPSCRAANPPAA